MNQTNTILEHFSGKHSKASVYLEEINKLLNQYMQHENNEDEVEEVIVDESDSMSSESDKIDLEEDDIPSKRPEPSRPLKKHHSGRERVALDKERKFNKQGMNITYGYCGEQLYVFSKQLIKELSGKDPACECTQKF